MKLFHENLDKFKQSSGFSDSDILELSEFSPKQLDELIHADFPEGLMYRFCLELGLDYRFIYSSAGFQSLSLGEQYDSYPNDLKQVVSRIVCREVYRKSILDEKEFIKLMPFHNTLSWRIFAGSRFMSFSQLTLFRDAVGEFYDPYKFNYLLASTMYSKIRNHNYNVARKEFKVTYQQIAEELGISSSGTSNWGGTYCAHMPIDQATKIAKVLGGIETEIFISVPLRSKDFKGKECSITSKVKVPDSQIDDPVIDNNIDKTSVQLESDSVKLTDSMIMKMYSQLDRSSRSKVDNLITELFFNQI